MQTNISEDILDTEAGAEANRILRSCVHCGFCTATCPTYQELGDELDGPRGRIYLIKDMLEGGEVTDKTRQHLDRCLSCRACETTCPSGVEYVHLAEIGRQLAEQKAPRPLRDRLFRKLLLAVLPFRQRFSAMLKAARLLKPLLPAQIKSHLPAQAAVSSVWPKARHQRTILLIEGCVQPVLAPDIDAVTAQVLDKLGISTLRTAQAQCCGAVEHHMNAHNKALDRMRANIDLWWPYIEGGAEAIVSTASACALEIKEYAYLLRNDAEYAEKAVKLSAACRDISEILMAEDVSVLKSERDKSVAFHASCTLQHGQKLNGVVEDILQRVGYQLQEVRNAHLCCGSAGTSSILQPQLSNTLRDNKLAALSANKPDLIATANIGCLNHLASGTERSVKHWVELLL
ncbi:MAG: glycolate oxidase subunit GlcF [Mariprofundus sp.]